MDGFTINRAVLSTSVWLVTGTNHDVEIPPKVQWPGRKCTGMLLNS